MNNVPVYCFRPLSLTGVEHCHLIDIEGHRLPAQRPATQGSMTVRWWESAFIFSCKCRVLRMLGGRRKGLFYSSVLVTVQNLVP